jgi:hypothetical protein
MWKCVKRIQVVYDRLYVKGNVAAVRGDLLQLIVRQLVKWCLLPLSAQIAEICRKGKIAQICRKATLAQICRNIRYK